MYMKITIKSGLLILVVLILGILTSLTNTNVSKDSNSSGDTKNMAMGSMILSWLLFVAIVTGMVMMK
jgi:hypothetical protein